VVVIPGVTMAVPVVIPPGFQVYVVPPVAVIVALSPGQIVWVGDTVKLAAAGNTVMVKFSVLLQVLINPEAVKLTI
jgi:hypothetical protein